MNILEKIATDKRISAVTGIILIVAVIAIMVLSIQAYVKSNSDENLISSLNEQVDELETQVTAAETKLIILSAQLDDAEGTIASSDAERDSDIQVLKEGLSETNNTINSINNQVASLVSNYSKLQSDITKDASSIASIQSQLSSVSSQLSSLNSGIASVQNRLNTLENTVDSLVAASNYPNPPYTNSLVLLSSHTFYQSAGTQTVLYTYTTPLTGYFYFTGSSNSAATYIRVVNNSTSVVQDYPFGTGKTFSIQVAPGNNYSVIFGNTASSGTVQATMTVVYYY